MAIRLDLGDIQGLFARGYREHRYARFTIFTIAEAPAGRALLEWLLPHLTTAASFSGDLALQVAFTASGLRELGLPDHVVTGFAAEFRQGMTNPNRSRFLGDAEESDPRGWAWGGPDGPPADGLLMLYATDPGLLEHWQAELRQQLEKSGITGTTELTARELGDTEPFGFHDGISQPVIAGLPKAAQAMRTVPAGEFILGYPNARGQLTGRPLVAGVRRSQAPAAARPDRERRGRLRPQRHLPGLPPARTRRRGLLAVRGRRHQTSRRIAGRPR